MFGLSPHRRDCRAKQLERQNQLDALPSAYTEPCTEEDNKILDLSLTDLVHNHASGSLSTRSILQAYGKKVVAAQKATNCLAAVLIPDILDSDAPPQIPSTFHDSTSNTSDTDVSSPVREKPLLSGVPVSIKDCIDIQGYDTTIGYSSRVNQPASSSAAIVRLLHSAGAITHVKTTTPPGMLGLETSSDLFGRTSNPYNADYVSGASTGGGGALLAYKGSMIEIGTDIGGSVRLPAHWCGIYAMKSSIGRFPGWGATSPLPGFEGVETSCSPMSSRLDNLEEFWKRVMMMRPWEYDHTCIPIPWRPVNLRGRKLRWGVMWEDDLVVPTPACRRALQMTVDALRKQGHEVVDFTPPSISKGILIGLQLCFSDGGQDFFSFVRKDEKLDPLLVGTKTLLSIPLFIKRILAAVTPDALQSAILTSVHAKTPAQERALVVEREQYRAHWRDVLEESGFDYILCLPHPAPAIPRGTSEKATFASCGSMMIWNILDYSAGVLPVTTVQPALDALPPAADFPRTPEYARMGVVARDVYALYDAQKMEGLPIGVQVVGRRFEEEAVLAGMRVVEEALAADGKGFNSGKVF
ncbi:amidase signature domain-containing protein [Scleroderma yunnanense]